MKSKTVILAEKPSQARKYAQAYNIEKKDKHHIEITPNETFKEGAIITWATGHFSELQPPAYYDEKNKRWSMDNLPIFPQEFTYKISDDKKVHFNKVKEILRNSSTIIIGTDIDREGEAIARLAIQHSNANNKEIKRLWINTLEKDEIQKGMNNLLNGEDTYNMFIEAQTRQHADWLVGMNLSPLFSLQLQNKGFNGSLGIGRVQSPTVYLIYKRQKEIENFQSEPFFELESTFSHNNGNYKGKAKIKEKNKEKVKEILKDHGIELKDEGYIKNIEKSTKVNSAPKLHSLSSLQTKANKEWKYSPKKVLEIAQSLYDKQYLSYPRTDSNYITESEYSYLLENVNKYQELLNLDFEINQDNKKYVSNEKVGEHFAIIPTRTLPKIESLSSDEKNIFFEVLRTTLSMFHKDNLLSETTIITEVKELEFKTKGTINKQKGWTELFPKKHQKEKENILPEVSNNDKVTSEINIKEGVTKPPKRYTLGQLVTVMMTCGKYVDDIDDVNILKEVEGIGTEATRGDIIETIQKQGYIESKNNNLFVTPKGEMLCEAIEGTLLASPQMTAKWESYLKKIGNGKGSKAQFIDKIQSFISKMIAEIPSDLNNNQNIQHKINEMIKDTEITKCPSCKGSIEDKGKFYGCSGYKEGCKVSFPKKWSQKNLTKTMIKSLCENKETNKLKGFISKKGNSFSAKLTLDKDNKLKFDFN